MGARCIQRRRVLRDIPLVRPPVRARMEVQNQHTSPATQRAFVSPVSFRFVPFHGSPLAQANSAFVSGYQGGLEIARKTRLVP
jgi:hypothetical protein